MSYNSLYKYLFECFAEVEAYQKTNEAEAEKLFREVTFQGGNLPDYSQSLVQSVYALRFMYARAFGYREMFRCLLRTGGIPKHVPLDILSVGCGNGIDYWAVWMACKESSKGKKLDRTFIYTGLDLVDWQRKWGKGYLSNAAAYVQCDAVEYLEKQPYLRQNVFVFPQSISEFSEEDFEKLCGVFAGKRFCYPLKNSDERKERNNVHILVSLRWAGLEEDRRRSDLLADAMEQNDFRLESPEKAKVFLGEDEYGELHISDCGFELSFPGNMMDFFRAQHDKGNGAMPSVHAKYTCYRVMTFVRKGSA